MSEQCNTLLPVVGCRLVGVTLTAILALYTLKHHPAESVTSGFFIADPSYAVCNAAAKGFV